MKKIFALILMSLAVLNLSSCIPSYNYNNVFDTPTDTLYTQCKNLKGLGQLRIGNTLKQVEHNFKQNLSEYNSSVNTSFIGGKWGVYDSYSNHYELIRYLEKNATNIKQCYVYDYKIGDVYIGKVSCAFYKNALVAIYFDCPYEVKEQFITKYGNGKGFQSEIEKGFDGYYGKILYKMFYYHKEDEKRIWANENVTMEYEYHSIHHNKFMSDEYIIDWDIKCIITSNDGGYEKFLNELEKYQKLYKEEKQSKRQETLNQL